MAVRPADFKSAASTGFAIPAGMTQSVRNGILARSATSAWGCTEPQVCQECANRSTNSLPAPPLEVVSDLLRPSTVQQTTCAAAKPSRRAGCSA
jgi:hypothetical protein